MKNLVWHDEYMLGIPAVDIQHKRIFDCFVSIGREGLPERGGWLADPLFVRLIDALQKHFALEEAMMRNLNYPELEQHIDEHRQLRDELNALAQRAAEAEGRGSHRMIKIFERWQHKHIMTTDRRYVEYFQNPMQKKAGSATRS